MEASRPLRILWCVSEVAPLSKTGGLGDVAGALPRAIAGLGHEVRIATPFYRGVNPERYGATPGLRLAVGLKGRPEPVEVWEGRLSDGVGLLLFRHDRYFGRAGLYVEPQASNSQERGRDYPDNLERFTLFCRAVLEWLAQSPWVPDLVHTHEWQTALLPVYLRMSDRKRRIPTVFTIHNLAYQGLFPASTLPITGLGPEQLTVERIEFYGGLNLMKGAILDADLVTTVSPTYSREIRTAEQGCGLEGVLARRGEALFGVLNGVDYEVWDPRRDPLIPFRYDADDLSGKASCKEALLKELGLSPGDRGSGTPLIGIVSRLTDQKGWDLIVAVIEELMHLDVSLAILGTGEPRYQRLLEEVARRHPRRVGLRLGFDEGLAHRIEAGADIFLMPSRYEPCGLNQLYSLRYGTVPVVRATGGLADTVVPYTPSTALSGEATGFAFTACEPSALLNVLLLALEVRRDPERWRAIQRAGMQADFSWERSAREYVRLYHKVCAAS